MFDSLPADHELESLALGALMRESELSSQILVALADDDSFSTESNRRIFHATAALDQRRERIDSVAIGHELHRRRQLEAVGGLSRLAEISCAWAPGTADPEMVVRELRKLALRRRIIRTAQSIAMRATDPAAEPEELADELQRVSRQITDEGAQACSATGAQIIERSGGLEKFLKPRPGVDTGFRELNRLTGGYVRGDLVILAARPSVGKTAYALAQAAHAANRAPVLFFSLEMEAEALMLRLIGARAKVTFQSLRLGLLTSDQRRTVMAASSEVAALGIRYERKLGSTILGIRSELQKAAKDQPALVVIDYLQLMRGSGARRQDRNGELAEITRSLKLLASEFGVPFVVLSQLTRTPARESRPPILSDLRDSGAIEQDADLVLFLHPESQQFPSPVQRVELVVAKQRNGALGSIALDFDKRFGTFVEDLSAAEAF